MPINSIQRRPTDPSVGLACFGKITKGLPRTQEQLDNKKPGTDVDYFVFQYNERYEWLKPHVIRLYGEQPKELSPILILGATPDDSFETWRVLRGMNGKRVVQKCDEENIVEWMDAATGRTVRAGSGDVDYRPCPGGRAEGGCDKCAFSGALRIALPGLLQNARVYGYWYLNTHSVNDIAMISSVLQYWYDQRIGNVWEMPFVLGRAEDHAGWGAYQKDGKTIPVERRKNLLYLEAHESTAQRLLQQLAAKTGALPAPASDLDELGDGQAGDQPALPATAGGAPAEKKPAPQNAGGKAYDAEVIYKAVERHFENKGAFNNWLGKAVHDKVFTDASTSDEIITTAKAQFHPLAVSANKVELSKLINSLGLQNSDILNRFYADHPIERLSQLPSDWTVITDRIQQLVVKSEDIVDGEIVEEAPIVPPEDIPENVVDMDDDPTWKWTPELMQGFDMEIMTLLPRFKTAKELRDAFQVDQWSHSPKYERNLIFAKAQKEGWEVVCATVSYVAGNKPGDSYIVFFTVLGQMRFYSRSEFAKLLPDSWVRANGVMSWETLEEPRDIDPLILTWEAKTSKNGNVNYQLVTGARPADTLDSVLSGANDPPFQPDPPAEPNPLLD